MLEIEEVDYEGTVYDLQVENDESFVASGIVVHNCTIVPVIRGFAPTTWKSGSTWFGEQSADVQRKMLGPERYKLFKSGTPLTDFVQVTDHETWGPSLKLRPLDRMN